MWRHLTLATPWRSRTLAVIVCLTLGSFAVPGSAAAQRAEDTPPVPLVGFDVRTLAGEWFEVANWGSAWAHRRCTANTRFTFTILGTRRVGALRACTTATGVELRRGRLAAPVDGTGALRGRFVPTLLAWVPSASVEYWVIASGPGQEWLLVGDRTRDRLAVWSRKIAIDESALAAAIAAGRAQGFDATRLNAVGQPAGPDALVRARTRAAAPARPRG